MNRPYDNEWQKILVYDIFISHVFNTKIPLTIMFLRDTVRPDFETINFVI